MSDRTYSFDIDLDALKMKDFEDFADLVGKELEDVLEPAQVYEADGSKALDEDGRPLRRVRLSSKARTVLLWLINRKTIPDFSLEDAGEVAMGQLTFSTDGGSGESEDVKGND